MEPTPANVEELYRAALGDQKADFYLPKFLAFDEPGSSKVSWNWSAFFITFPWMLYRRMYGPALLYQLALPIALTIICVLLTMVLGGTAGAAIYFALGLVIFWVVVPTFANALYHRHVRKQIEKVLDVAPTREAAVQRLIGQSSVASGALVAIIVLVCFVPIAGILAAIAIPAYQDYTIRAQVSDGLMLAAPVKAAIVEAYDQSKTVPANLEAIGFRAADFGPYVESIEVADGVVFIRYGNVANRLIAGGTLTLTPVLTDAGEFTWACGYAAGEASGTDIKPKYLPSACRQ